MKALNKISVFGLGKVGAPLLASVASAGFEVVGVDVDSEKVNKINSHVSPVFEHNLANYLKKYKKLIKAYSDYQKAINNSQISLIIVPTLSKKNGSFSNQYVIEVIKKIGRALRKKKDFHLIVLLSTVSPGSMEKEIMPALVRASGKEIGKEIGLCYNPGFIALGNVIDNFLSPDFVLIGESDIKSGDILKKYYQRFCLNNPPIIRMNFINAEISKLVLNAFVTTKISYANMLTELCEQTPGADVRAITEAIGLDKRIGKKCLTGALSYGGPCFPRDNRALRAFAKSKGLKLALAEATDKINQRQIKTIVKLIKNKLNKKKKIAILGLAYKPNTDVAQESAGVKLSLKLAWEGYQVVVYDPWALTSARTYLANKVTYLESLDHLKQVDLIVITTAWDIYRKKLPLVLKKKKLNPIILDCWRILEPKNLSSATKYLVRGKYLS